MLREELRLFPKSTAKLYAQYIHLYINIAIKNNYMRIIIVEVLYLNSEDIK
jgi:hypothetical protein